jgi:prepilin-type N-terminal cleavage/methylation domain-containing protein
MLKGSLWESALVQKKGFTLIEVIVVVAVLGILTGIAVSSYRVMINRAYKVTLQHDLQSFAKVEEAYFNDHGSYLGVAGDTIQGDDIPTGTLAVPDLPFSPSVGVLIEIISGPPSFKARASHSKTDAAYEYDFVTRETTER